MPWLSEFDEILAAAAHIGGGSAGQGGEARGAVDPRRLWPDGAAVDDPREGRIESARMEAYLESSRQWLAERHARVERLAITTDSRRSVGEFHVELVEGDRRFVLPLAVAVEPSPDGRRAEIRVYHSQWPLIGHHVVRQPLLKADPSAHESDVVGEYQAALAAGDARGCVATFEPDGCFREPAGPQFSVCGTADLTEFYTRFFSAGGGIILEHCTVTEDGVRSALEFNAVRWGGTALAPQAGIAVYERGVTGRIAQARVYDDVEGPVE